MPVPAPERSTEVPSVVDIDWLRRHLDFSVNLGAYTEGVRQWGETSFDDTSPENREFLRGRIDFECEEGAEFPLSDEQILGVLAHFPRSWHEVAALRKIDLRKPALFVLGNVGEGNSFIRGIEVEQEGQRYFDDGQNPLQPVTAGFYEEKKLTPPEGPDRHFQYAPGQYVEGEECMRLWEEPPGVRATFDEETRRQYGRELVLHEYMHSVIRTGGKYMFVIGGTERTYASLLEELYDICQEEPESTSAYAELYKPWLQRKCNLRDWKCKWAVQEELGELCASAILGWGATPSGRAARITERDFGGQHLRTEGKSRKFAFVERLLGAKILRRDVTVRVDDAPVHAVTDTQREQWLRITRAAAETFGEHTTLDFPTGGFSIPLCTEEEMQDLHTAINDFVARSRFHLMTITRTVGPS